MQARLTTAVRETESATSPLASLEIILLVTPPGQKERIITPTANSGGGVNRMTSTSAMNGTTII